MKAIIVGKRKSPPTIHNIRTGRLIMSLTVPDAPYSPVTCITTNSELVYVCDSSNKVCVFDTKNKKPHTDTILGNYISLYFIQLLLNSEFCLC